MSKAVIDIADLAFKVVDEYFNGIFSSVNHRFFCFTIFSVFDEQVFFCETIQTTLAKVCFTFVSVLAIE